MDLFIRREDVAEEVRRRAEEEGRTVGSVCGEAVKAGIKAIRAEIFGGSEGEALREAGAFAEEARAAAALAEKVRKKEDGSLGKRQA